MSNICQNCGNEFEGNKCTKCGYTVNLENSYKNIINSSEYKEHIADTALSVLANNNLISFENDLKNLRVEFGYLLISDGGVISSLLKVIVHNGKRVYYFGISKGQLNLLDEKFNDDMFKKISYDMLTMHKVDINSENPNDYVIELY